VPIAEPNVAVADSVMAFTAPGGAVAKGVVAVADWTVPIVCMVVDQAMAIAN
jgi:hypothetical protein